ncbi:hypothetical protein MBLNU459_g4745t2 [Dothideomycetes sp. NU459]
MAVTAQFGLPSVLDSSKSTKLKCNIVFAIEDARVEMETFLHQCLDADSYDSYGKSGSMANTIADYLSGHGIRTVIVSSPRSQPSIVSLFNEPEGPSLIMNGLIDVDSSPLDSETDLRQRGPGDELSDAQKRKIGIIAGTAATVVAYTHLHARRKLLHGTVVLTIVSDNEKGAMGGYHHLLEEDERRELFKGDCVLNAEPTGFNKVVVIDTKHRSLATHPLVQGIVHNAKDIVGQTPILVPPKIPTHSHVWSGLGVPTCSYGLPITTSSTISGHRHATT